MALLNGVTIQGNQFKECHPAAFRAMVPNDNYWRHHNIPMQFRILSNSLSTMERISPLILSDKFDVTIDDLRYLNHLNCEDISTVESTEFFRRNRDSIQFRLSDKLIDSTKDTEFNTVSHIASHNCVTRSWFWYYVLMGSALLLILLIVLVILLCLWYRKRKAQKMSLIVPDGRTYRETTIVMQIENHNLLKTDL